MKRHLFAALFAALALHTQAVLAQAECPVITADEVAEAFGAEGATLLAGDVSGMCTWSIEDGGTLNVQTHKRPNAKEAGQMFDSFEKTTTGRLPRTLSRPRIGQRALVTMSADAASRAEAAILALDQETLVAIYYYPDPDEEVSAEDMRPTLETVGALVLGRKAQADQTFGQCELLDPRDIERLLGKGKKTIHRLGPLQCIASVQPGSGSLVVMGSRQVGESSLASMAEMAGNGCERVMLPEFGEHAHATYACEAPGDAAMAMHMVRDGLYFSIVYAPSQRKTGAADVQALKPVAQRIYQMR